MPTFAYVGTVNAANFMPMWVPAIADVSRIQESFCGHLSIILSRSNSPQLTAACSLRGYQYVKIKTS